jgi:fimbrial chaperone protein
MRSKKVIPALSLTMLCLLTPLTAWCGSFTVSPVRIQVSASRPNAILQISNRDDQPVTIQAHVVTWSFENQADIYVNSDDIMLNPPIATIGAHQSQLIRLGSRHPNQGAQEISYRLIVEEVPPPPQSGFRGVQTILRLSIPIFAVPKTTTSARLKWQAARTADSRLLVTATNQGSAHIQIKALDVASAESTEDYLKGIPPTYLLPKQQREWVIADERARTANRIKVIAVTDAGVSHEIVDVTPQ